MKAFRILLVLVMLFAVAPIATPASAEPAAPMPPLCSVVRVQNKGSVAADPVTLNFYRIGDNDGVAEYSYTDPLSIAPAVARSYDISSATFSLLPTGSYAVVITSNQPLASVVVQTTCSGGSPYIAAAHNGFEQKDVSTTLHLPYVVSRAWQPTSWSSFIAIQNAGSTTGTNVRIDFYARNQSGITETFTNNDLKPGETWYLDLKSGAYATANLNEFKGSAKITSDVPVAAIVNYAPDASNTLMSYHGTATPSQKLYATQMSKSYGATSYTGGWTIVNPNATTTPLVLRFYQTGQTTPSCTVNKTLNAYETWTGYAGNVGGSIPCATGSLPNGYNGYMVAEVTSGTNKILGIFNFIDTSGQSAAGLMIPSEYAATTLYYPFIIRNMPNSYQSGYLVFNTSANPVNLQIDYIKEDGTTTLTETPVLQGNQTLSVYVGNKTTLGSNWSGSLKITITSGTGPILGHANLVSLTLIESYSLFTPVGP